MGLWKRPMNREQGLERGWGFTTYWLVLSHFELGLLVFLVTVGLDVGDWSRMQQHGEGIRFLALTSAFSAVRAVTLFDVGGPEGWVCSSFSKTRCNSRALLPGTGLWIWSLLITILQNSWESHSHLLQCSWIWCRREASLLC